MDASRQSWPLKELHETVRMFEQLLPVALVNERQPPLASAVYTPWIVTWLMVYQRLCSNASLAEALGELAQLHPDLLPDTKRTRAGSLSANTGGYARARQRLDVAVAEWAADAAYQALVTATPPSLGDRRVLTIDGSSLSLASTPALRGAYPPGQNQHGPSHWPVLRLVMVHELSSGCAVRPEAGPMYGSAAIGEVALAAWLLERLPAASVLLGDRNFGVFACAWAARQAGHDVVLRLTEKRFRALVRGATLVQPGEWRLDWRPSRWDRDADPTLPADAAVAVQLHEIRVSDELTLWLVSTVAASAPTLAALYHRRLDVETDIRDYKRTLRMDELRGRSPDMVHKELAAATIAYNLVLLTRRLGAARAQVEPRRLSFARIHSLVKVLLLNNPAVSDPVHLQKRLDQILRMAGQCKLPNRPGRSFPRQVLTRRRKFPPRPPNQQPAPTK